MSTTGREQTPLDQLRVGETANFVDGPPLELFRRLRELCDSRGILLIADEIQTGAGRT